MNLEIFVPYDGPSLNKIWAGVHWSKRKKWAADAHKAVMSVYPKTILQMPVTIEYTPILGRGKRAFDCSNYAAITKSLEDGLVACGALPDDSPKYVRSVKTNAPIRGKETGVRVLITEVDAE